VKTLAKYFGLTVVPWAR